MQGLCSIIWASWFLLNRVYHPSAESRLDEVKCSKQYQLPDQTGSPSPQPYALPFTQVI